MKFSESSLFPANLMIIILKKFYISKVIYL